jgi:23S rRNA (pseudouridine1915-N3)-methyltransferase
MRIVLAAITPRRKRLKSAPAQALAEEFLGRIAQYAPAELQLFESEEALLSYCTRQSGRAPLTLILMDSRGRSLSSEAFAAKLARLRDSGTPQLVLAIGPASGWSYAAHAQASASLSLGQMTLPHELALVVLAEQVYRAHTILAKHPYHSGH